jgi:uncharacterized membrane protein YdjX (TVP38/TMEM64 family)
MTAFWVYLFGILSGGALTMAALNYTGRRRSRRMQQLAVDRLRDLMKGQG